MSLGTTAGLRTADAALEASLQRAGASVAVARVPVPPRLPPTLAAQDLLLARAARGLVTDARAVVYSSTTAALLWPRPGAIRFDALSAANRPGRHGVWQRPVERRRLEAAPLLLPWSAGALAEGPSVASPTVVGAGAGDRPARPRPARATSRRSPTARIRARRAWTACWARGRWRAGRARRWSCSAARGSTRRACAWQPLAAPGRLPRAAAAARAYVTAPRREDYGMAQLEALAEGCQLVTDAGAGAVRGAAARAGARRPARGRRPGGGAAHRARRPGARLRRARGRGAAPVAPRRGRRAGGRTCSCRRCSAR